MPSLVQQQKSAFEAGDCERRVNDRGQHVIRGKRILQRSRDLDQSAQLRQISGARRRCLRGGELVEDFLNFVVLEREDQAVGIRKSELDPIGGVQLLARHL